MLPHVVKSGTHTDAHSCLVTVLCDKGPQMLGSVAVWHAEEHCTELHSTTLPLCMLQTREMNLQFVMESLEAGTATLQLLDCDSCLQYFLIQQVHLPHHAPSFALHTTSRQQQTSMAY